MRPATVMLSRRATAAAVTATKPRQQVQLLLSGAATTVTISRAAQPSYPSNTRSISSLPRCAQQPPRHHTSPSLLRRRRYYHSHEHPAPPGPFNATEEAILSAAYKQVPLYGFSLESLARGAREAGYLDISTTILPEGAFSLIRYHLVKQREALAGRRDELFAPEESRLIPVSEKVEMLAWERLLGNKDVIGRWQEVRTYAGTGDSKTPLLR